MKFFQLLAIVLFSAVTTLAVSHYTLPSAQTAPEKETRLEQIKRTGTLRCGYSIWPPALMKDPNTGAFSGMFYDLMQEMGKQLSLKIEWTVEVTPAHMFADLDSNRIDMVCSAYIATPARAKAAAFTSPIFYNVNTLFVRADDTRFDNNFEAANDPSVKFAVVDGGLSSILANQKFPLAQKPSVPELSTPADTFLYVAERKADVVLSEPLSFALFDKSNPGKMKRAVGEPPFVYGAGMPMPLKEFDLHNTINATLAYLQSTGVVAAIFDKHETEGVRTLRLAKPYAPAD
ncbi:MAG: transporter substrate-binding domain-containing protein [Alphaproteobacteria bacterium]|nr:transporter substrate-binding domain-containing protein [Alphaproteobacteria bacterium]